MITTCSLETSKLLKEAGFRQDSDFVWVNYLSHYMNKDAFVAVFNSMTHAKICSAPTTDEILEELPDRINEESGVLMIHKMLDHYEVIYGGWNNQFDSLELPKALAQMWLYLKKEGLI